MTPYACEVEQQMQRFYNSLNERDRRRYAAIEAVKLGWGGRSYIQQLLGCDYYTLQVGMSELAGEETLNPARIRRAGGGRKRALETLAGLDEAFLKVIAEHTAGSPTDETIKWTNLTR